MTTEVALALIAGLVTGAGWLVTHYLERQREQTRLRREARGKYLERQVEELYGPLFNLTMQIVATNHVRYGVLSNLPTDKRGAIDQLFYREYFRPLHDATRELLRTRLHLVEGNRLPESFYQYLRHSIQERVQQDLWSEHQIDTSAVKGVPFPNEFPALVQTTLEQLLREYDLVLSGLHYFAGKTDLARRLNTAKEFADADLE
jgi:hypothetical protein